MLIDSSPSNRFVRESAKLLEPDSIRDYTLVPRRVIDVGTRNLLQRPGRIFFLDEVRALSQWCDGKVMTGLSSLRHLHDVIACGCICTEKVVLAHT